MIERIVKDFRHASVYASHKGAFETIPLWFKLNKDKSVAMRQMVEFVVPTMNVLRYHHFVECNDSVHEYIETHKHDSVMSASDIYELLSIRFPMQVGNMVLTDCCSASKECDFSKMFYALANRDENAFCESASDVLPRLSGLVEAWREVYTPFRVWSETDSHSADGDAESLIQSLCNILDRCDEKSFDELKDNLYRCHFTIRAYEVRHDGMQEFASQAKKHFNSIFTMLYHNVYRVLEPEWIEDNPWLESLLIECRRQYKIVWEVDCKPNSYDSGSELGKIDLSKFGEPDLSVDKTQPKHVRRRKVCRPISMTATKPEATNDEEVSCYYDIEAPETDDGDDLEYDEKISVDIKEAQQVQFPLELQSDEVKKVFNRFVEEGYLELRDDGRYNWKGNSLRSLTYWVADVNKALKIKDNGDKDWSSFKKIILWKDETRDDLCATFNKKDKNKAIKDPRNYVKIKRIFKSMNLLYQDENLDE